MAAAEVDAVAFEEPDLLRREDEGGVLGDGLLEAEEALQPRFQVVAEPDSADPDGLTVRLSRRSWLATRWAPWVGGSSP